MPPRLLPSTALIVGLLALPAGPARTRQPAARPPEPRRARKPAADASRRTRAAPAAQPGEAGLAREIAERLAASGGDLSAADREDRAALATFYAGRQQEPVWVGATGLTPAGEAWPPKSAAPTTGASTPRRSGCRP